MSNIFLSVCVASVLFLSGCASLASLQNYPVSIGSDAPDAVVTLKNRRGVEIHRGPTPVMLTLPAGDGFFRSARYTMEFEKPGYISSAQTVRASIDGWYAAGNFIFGGFIGWLFVDPVTGAMWKLPDLVHADLVVDPQYQAKPTSEESGPADQRNILSGQGKAAIDRLREIKDLYDTGILTEEEYETRKAVLLQEF